LCFSILANLLDQFQIALPVGVDEDQEIVVGGVLDEEVVVVVVVLLELPEGLDVGFAFATPTGSVSPMADRSNSTGWGEPPLLDVALTVTVYDPTPRKTSRLAAFPAVVCKVPTTLPLLSRIVIMTTVLGSADTTPADRTKCMTWLCWTTRLADADEAEEFSVPEAFIGNWIGDDRKSTAKE
jgi:hypothetical protein